MYDDEEELLVSEVFLSFFTFNKHLIAKIC